MAEKVAIFLDVENLSGWLKADGGNILLERTNELGRVVVRRAYGDFSIQSVSVRQVELNLLGFEFVHVYHPVKGKNSADIQIVVDAMEYVARIPDLEWIVLATGDSDFSPLFRRLRELGKSVVGVGPRSALSEAVKESCNRFIYIDETQKVDPVTNENLKSDMPKSTPLREDALSLLERVLDQFPDGISLSILKNEMLELDSAFNEKDLGFSGFMKFLQDLPEIVYLYETKQGWHAKSRSYQDKSDGLSHSGNKSETASIEPTVELYRSLLRKSGWVSCSTTFLWDVLTDLSKHFPDGFTRSEEFEYLIESFGRNRTRGELRAAMYILYKANFILQHQKKQSDEPILHANVPESERNLSKKVDFVILHRLISVCKSQNIDFQPELALSLLNNSYTKEQFPQMLERLDSIK